jgi:hypothetical protein
MFIKDLLNELTFTSLNATNGVAITANGVGTAVSLAGVVGEAVIALDLPAATAGTLPTLSVAVTTCATSGGSYVPLNNAAGSAIVFTTATATKVYQQLSIDTRIALGYIQLAWTIGGTSTPSFPSLAATLVSSAQVH